MGLYAIRAAAAGVGGFPLLAKLVYVADEYPTLKTRAGTLKASVVRLYGVVVVVEMYPIGVHSYSSFLWAGLRGAPTPAGPFLYPTLLLYHMCIDYV